MKSFYSILFLLLVNYVFSQDINSRIIISDDIMSIRKGYTIERLYNQGDSIFSSPFSLGLYYNDEKVVNISKYLNFNLYNNKYVTLRTVRNKNHFPGPGLYLLLRFENISSGQSHHIQSINLQEFINNEDFDFYDLRFISDYEIIFTTGKNSVLKNYSIKFDSTYKSIKSFELLTEINLKSDIEYFQILPNSNRNKLYLLTETEYIITEAYKQDPKIKLHHLNDFVIIEDRDLKKNAVLSKQEFLFNLEKNNNYKEFKTQINLAPSLENVLINSIEK